MTDWKALVIETIRQKILAENPNTNNFELPPHLAKKVQTYMSMRDDLILCIKTATELKKCVEKGPKDEHQHILTALWTSMIVVYAKCFTDASRVKKSKLEIKTVLTSEKKDLLEMHEKIMDIRHSFIAHRGDNENDQVIVFFSLPKKPDGSTSTAWNIKSFRANNFGIDNIRLSEELFNSVLNHVQTKLHSDVEKVHKHIMTIDKETLKSWLIKPDKP